MPCSGDMSVRSRHAIHSGREARVPACSEPEPLGHFWRHASFCFRGPVNITFCALWIVRLYHPVAPVPRQSYRTGCNLAATGPGRIFRRVDVSYRKGEIPEPPLVRLARIHRRPVHLDVIVAKERVNARISRWQRPGFSPADERAVEVECGNPIGGDKLVPTAMPCLAWRKGGAVAVAVAAHQIGNRALRVGRERGWPCLSLPFC